MGCPLCGSNHLEHFAKRVGVPVLQNVSFKSEMDAKKIKKGNIDLVSCKNCNFVFNASFQDVAYTENYENDQSHSAYFAEHVNNIAEKISRTINLLTGTVKIIEIGCGQGSFLKNLISKISSDINCQAIGFDPACREKNDDEKSKIQLIPEYYSQKHLNGEEYDHLIIIARHVIEHIAGIHKFFLESLGTNVRGRVGDMYFLKPRTLIGY